MKKIDWFMLVLVSVNCILAIINGSWFGGALGWGVAALAYVGKWIDTKL
jgi:uncharacterized protein (DUF58 family)